MSSELALRLRQLRESCWPDRSVTQPQLAAALGMATSSVSSWENRREPKVPPPHRLRAIATFFATARSLDGPGPQVLPDPDLTAEERSGRDRLLAELTTLASGDEAATLPAPVGKDFWHFPDGEPVRIVAGQLDRDTRPVYAAGSHRNYMALSAYADQDSVFDLYGHIRACNPESDVKVRLVTRLENSDMRAHLVIVGYLAKIHVPVNSFTGDKIPVRQVEDESVTDGEVFEVSKPDGRSERITPLFRGPDGPVIQDVGFLMRMAKSPYNRARSLTVCTGVYTRGVYGVVRCTTDSQYRAANQRHLAATFGSADCFGILLRVPTYEHTTGTPVLPGDIIFQFDF